MTATTTPTTPAKTVSGPGIKFENIGLTLGRTEILRDVSFTVGAGTVHARVGPNGGGKSS